MPPKQTMTSSMGLKFENCPFSSLTVEDSVARVANNNNRELFAIVIV